PAIRVSRGEECHLELGVSCGDIGTHCSSAGVCEEGVGAEEECTTPTACSEPGYYCAGLRKGASEPGLCRPRVSIGEPCDPADIWPCAVGPNGYCSPDGICVDEWPALCGAIHPPPGSYQAIDWIPPTSSE